MFDLFKFFSKDEASNKTIAKERLKLVLIHDRADISPRFLEMVRTDILRVLAEYIEVDESDVDIRLTRQDQGKNQYSSSLVANIPIKKMKKIGKNSQ